MRYIQYEPSDRKRSSLLGAPNRFSASPMKPKENIFYLDSASLCAPTRWSLREKFQQSLSELHQSVPGYKDKIDSRVNTIFTNLPDQKIFERYNWSIFDSPELFQPISNKSLVEIKNTKPEIITTSNKVICVIS